MEEGEEIPYSQVYNDWKKFITKPDLKTKANQLLDTYFKGYSYDPRFSLFTMIYFLYGQSVECFEEDFLEASMALLRSAIDGAAYIVFTRKPVYDEKHQLNGLTPIRDVSKSEHYRQRDLRCGLRGIGFNDEELKEIEEIREKGHFAVHLLAKQDEYLMAYSKESTNKTWLEMQKVLKKNPFLGKRLTIESEAEDALKRGGKYIGLIRNRFFDFYK